MERKKYNLLRFSDVNKTPWFPFKKSTLYKWKHLNKYPGLFIKIGGSDFVDLDVFEQIIEQGRH